MSHESSPSTLALAARVLGVGLALGRGADAFAQQDSAAKPTTAKPACIDTNAKGGEGHCYRSVRGRDLGRATVQLSAIRTF